MTCVPSKSTSLLGPFLDFFPNTCTIDIFRLRPKIFIRRLKKIIINYLSQQLTDFHPELNFPYLYNPPYFFVMCLPFFVTCQFKLLFIYSSRDRKIFVNQSKLRRKIHTNISTNQNQGDKMYTYTTTNQMRAINMTIMSLSLLFVACICKKT